MTVLYPEPGVLYLERGSGLPDKFHDTLNFRPRGSLNAGELLERHLVDVRLQESLLVLCRRPTGFQPGCPSRRRQLCLQPQLPAARAQRRLAAVLALGFGGSRLSPDSLRSSISGGESDRANLECTLRFNKIYHSQGGLGSGSDRIIRELCVFTSPDRRFRSIH